MSRLMKPYPETNFHLDKTNLSLAITAPWIKIDVKITNESCSSIDQILNEPTSDCPSSESIEFHEFFADFPIWTFQPLKEMNHRPTCESRDSVFDSNWEESVQEGHSMEMTLPVPNAADTLWDIDAILFDARIAGTQFFDPAVIYTEIRRCRLLDESRQDQSLKSMEYLLTNDEDRFLNLARCVLHQTHYVTSQCSESLSPAVELVKCGETKALIKEYIESEDGHHLLIERSLAGLSKGSIQPHLVLEATRQSMQTLRFAARNSILAFSCLLESFEGSSYRETDRFADLLLRSSKPKSADGLIMHHKINRMEQHASIGLRILNDYGQCTREDAIFAIKICQRLSELGREMLVGLMEGVA